MLSDLEKKLIVASPLFDEGWYASHYPDVALSGLSPLEHYLEIGAWLGRNPGPSFSMSGYLDRYPDVARAGLNPLLHFERRGRWEGRETGVPLSAGAPNWVRAGDSVVDVIVPVHNALEEVRACLESLARVRTGHRSRVLIVNDGSDAPTTTWLRTAVRTLGTQATSFNLLEHDGNRGYTAAVNTGLRVSRAPFVVTLNSDTVVTHFWLDGLIRCVTSAPDIGIAGPLSNAASWQNVPTLFGEDGAFAINALPPGVSPDLMAALVRRVSERSYPRTPFLDGFCYLIRREVIDRIGYMDEQAFPSGYGDENDYSIRAQDAGFALAVADSAYVFHAKSKSFGTERRIALSEAGTQALNAKHSPEKVAALLAEAKDTRRMDVVRARVSEALEELQKPAGRTVRDLVVSQRILFLLPVSPGGAGVHSLVQEVSAMRRMGVGAKVGVRQADRERYRDFYKSIPDIQSLLVEFTSSDVVIVASRFDVVVATNFTSARLLARIAKTCPWVLPAYYVQDYEPLFLEPGSDEWREAHDSYSLVPGAVLFAKTDWICQQVEREHGVETHRVLASVDHDIYRPSVSGPPLGSPVCVSAIIRPRTPRGGAGRTMELLKRLKQTYADRVEIRIFGTEDDNPDFQALPRDFEFEILGVLDETQMAAVLQEADIFVDLSDCEAFGRPSLEAMTCGAVALIPKVGGSDEFAQDGVNALVVDTQDLEACYARLAEVLDDRERLSSMQLAALRTAAMYSPRRAAMSELLVLASHLARLRQTAQPPVRTRLTLLPALAEDGRRNRIISQAGYVRLVQPYLRDAVASRFDVDISRKGSLPVPGTADLVVLQGDLSAEAWPRFERWHDQFRGAGGRLVYDIGNILAAEDEASPTRGVEAATVTDRIQTYARLADVITVPEPRLVELFPDCAEKVVIVPNALDERLWGLNGSAVSDDVAVPRAEGPVRIGCLTSSSRYEDLQLVQEAMNEVQARYGTAIEIEMIGDFQDRPPLFGTRIALPARQDYPSLVSWVRRTADWDFAILPLRNDPTRTSEAELAFLEMAALRTGILCSEVPGAPSLARHEENCLLAPNTRQAWVDALSRLIEDPTLRHRLSRNAYRDLVLQRTILRCNDLHLSVLDRAMEVVR